MDWVKVQYRGVQVRVSLTLKQMDFLSRDAEQRGWPEDLGWPEELLPVVREKAEVQYQKVRDQILANEQQDAERREACASSI